MSLPTAHSPIHMAKKRYDIDLVSIYVISLNKDSYP